MHWSIYRKRRFSKYFIFIYKLNKNVVKDKLIKLQFMLMHGGVISYDVYLGRIFKADNKREKILKVNQGRDDDEWVTDDEWATDDDEEEGAIGGKSLGDDGGDDDDEDDVVVNRLSDKFPLPLLDLLSKLNPSLIVSGTMT